MKINKEKKNGFHRTEKPNLRREKLKKQPGPSVEKGSSEMKK